jgi:uncharacterized membrane protein
MVTVPKVPSVKPVIFQKTLQWLLIALLILGVGFRFINLDRKIYWHDEAYTSLRAGGWTKQAIDQELFQNRLFAAPELQKFQQIKSGSTMTDTVDSLRIENPQHPPLYFGIARLWMQQFGGSITASRLLPALISLVSLPLMYGLALELFQLPLAALIATTLLALSPFDILFAQTARQYSLLTALIIGSSWLLVRMMRQPKGHWIGYGLTVAVGLYTHPFFALTSLGHAVYVAGLSWWEPKGESTAAPLMQRLTQWLRDRRVITFALANVVALLLYSPWIWVLLQNHGEAASTTDWARVPTSIWFLVKLWVLSFTALFFDLDFGFDNPVTYLLRVPFVLLIVAALYAVYRHTSRSTSLFIFSSILIPFLPLVIPDLVLGGRRSAVSRYLISCFPAVQLAVAYLFAKRLAVGKTFWAAILGLTLVGSILSCGISAAADTWWSKGHSYGNAGVIQLINAEADRSPVVISDRGDDHTNTGDLLGLSYGLNPNVYLYLVSSSPNLAPLVNEPVMFAFRPSQSVEQAINQQGWRLEPVSEDTHLWRIVK